LQASWRKAIKQFQLAFAIEGGTLGLDGARGFLSLAGGGLSALDTTAWAMVCWKPARFLIVVKSSSCELRGGQRALVPRANGKHSAERLALSLRTLMERKMSACHIMR